jgi:8-oxo-dGTP diphosphatase
MVKDREGRLLLVCQHHEGRDIWMLPGGAIEEGENAMEAAKREVLEETGLHIRVIDLVWHVEEVSPKRGQRFVNYFIAEILEGRCQLGRDPELLPEHQVLKEIRFMDRSEVEEIPYLYPPFLRDEVWDVLEQYEKGLCGRYPVYRNREEY